MADAPGGGVSRLDTGPPVVPDVSPMASEGIIPALEARQSVLEPDTPYARIADAVLAARPPVAEAELAVARLRERAAQKNWLPTIGPRLSLSSLGDVVADMVVNQVLFDNGRKKAERDRAKAEVELAAIALTEDGNTRVFDALSLYLQAEEGREAARHFDTALKDMSQFEWVMDQRVRGGVSDMSDLNVIRQKLAEIRARMQEAREQTATAMAELNAFADRPLDDLRGLGGLGAPGGGTPLSVLRAVAERDVALAEARIARAGQLPGLGATAVLSDGDTDYGATVQTDAGIGLGTAATLKAIEASKATARARVAEARETADRALAAQKSRLAALERQMTEAAGLSQQAKANLDLFQRQYDGGQRQVMDVVGVYETFARAREREIDLKYAAARAALEIARLRGGLADGARL